MSEQETSCFCSMLTKLVLLIGFFHLLKFTVGVLRLLNRHLLRKPQNFMKTYGDKDSWVVVTGGSDGIGEQFCKDLAKHGFNICIIARNEDKMKQKLESIKSLSNKPIKTRYVVADLA